MNILVLDDEPGVLENLRLHLTERFGGEHAFTFAANSEECVGHIANTAFDLLILDVQINGSSCIDLFAHLIDRRDAPEIVFITGFPLKYCEDIFNGVRPLAFLKKPVDYEKLFRVIGELNDSLNAAIPMLNIKYKGNEIAVPVGDIRFAESEGRLVHLDCRGGQYEYYDKLSRLAEELPGFIQCHKSFIVNPEYISQFEKNFFVLYDGMKIPISRKYGEQAKLRFFRSKGGFGHE